MARTLRIVNYAVNGAGVGHLTRLVAISRWLRRYATVLDLRLEIWFLTSSEADSWLFHEGFASFKLPSKTVVGDTGIDKTAYLALAKQWVWHSLGLLRPDLFVVDSFPRGSFGELLPALDLCQRRAFIFRPMKAAFAERAEFQAMLPLYDRILVPETDAPVPVPAAVRGRVMHVGPVQVRERVELLPRAVARQRLGIVDDRLAVYLSAGGGGDPTAVAQLEATVAALAPDASLHLVVGAGPLYRGRTLAGERLTWMSGLGVSESMGGLDVAVCAAGYNTFNELMQAGVPAIFLPQEKIADEQADRAERAVAAGAARRLPPGPMAETLPAMLAGWREPAARQVAAAAARGLVPANGARRAAAELLRLLVPESAVEAAEAMVTDEMLGAIAELSVSEALCLDLARALSPGPADLGGIRAADGCPAGLRGPPGGRRISERILDSSIDCSGTATPDDTAGDDPARAHGPEAEPESDDGDGALVGRGAVELVRAAAQAGDAIEPAVRSGILLVRRLPGLSVEARIVAIRRWLAAAEPFHDWAGAVALLKVFGTERVDPAGFVTELTAFLATLRQRGDDLYRGIAWLVAGHGPGAGAGGAAVANLDLLRQARRRMA